MLALAKDITLLVCTFANIFKLLRNDLTQQAPLALLHSAAVFRHSQSGQTTAQGKDKELVTIKSTDYRK